MSTHNDKDVTETKPNNGKIYRAYRDVYGCYHCKVTADRHAMEDHNCSMSLKEMSDKSVRCSRAVSEEHPAYCDYHYLKP